MSVPPPAGPTPAGPPPAGPTPAGPPPAGPTPEQVAERARRADRATRGVLAANLILEALIVLLVPRAIAFTSTGLDTTKTWLLVALAVALVLAGGLLRRPGGIAVASALQVVVVLTGVWIGAMYVLGAVFVAIWLYTLRLRTELVGVRWFR